jgi:hypothetical protein
LSHNGKWLQEEPVANGKYAERSCAFVASEMKSTKHAGTEGTSSFSPREGRKSENTKDEEACILESTYRVS